MTAAGRYRIGRVIRGGSAAEILEAEAIGEQGFERRVVIKRLGHEADERAFADEARILSRLHHPNIVSVFDFGLMDGKPFIALELVEGLDLGELLTQAGAALPVQLAAHAGAEVALGLAYAHDGGVVHRDVTPSNILVSWDGTVKLTDFGIALASGRLVKTIAGVAKGTLAYMAPEQLAGKTIDRRTDLFALGCVLHRMVAGKSPLESEDARRAMLVDGRVTIDPAIPAELARIIEIATSVAPADRYPSASAMADALTALGGGRAFAREWLARFAPASEAKAQHPVAALFELVLNSDAAPHPARRFDSVVRMETTRTTERTSKQEMILKELRHPNLMTAERVEGPTLADVLLREAPLDRARARRIARELRAGLAAAAGAGLEVRGLEPSWVILEGGERVKIDLLRALEGGGSVESLLAMLEKPRSRVPVVAVAAIVAAVAAVAAIALGDRKSPSPPAPEPPAPVSPGVVQRAGPIELDDVEIVVDAPKPVPAPRKKESPPALDAAERRVDAALARRGLDLLDLENPPELEAWRSAGAARDAEAAADRLIAVIDRAPIDEALVRARMKRVAALLDEHAKSERIAALEARYFEVRGRFRPPMSSAELDAIAREVRRVELELRALDH